MNTSEILQKLYKIYLLLRVDKKQEACDLFTSLKIVDTKDHLALPENLRHLIWNLYEYLILDNINYTDRKEIMNSFAILFEDQGNK